MKGKRIGRREFLAQATLTGMRSPFATESLGQRWGCKKGFWYQATCTRSTGECRYGGVEFDPSDSRLHS
jgi:hypothetical protein